MTLHELAQHIDKLQADTQPRWGKMTAQHMVEHLTSTLLLATGKNDVKVYTPQNQLAQMRAFLMSDKPIPRGVVSPAVGSELPKLRNESFEAAVSEFKAELSDFVAYYEANPEAVHINPAFGELSFPEWEQFMKKHFTHHFEQFGLLG
ncbi:oxepin-CoA hydrolase / 3-oxo-5,6-dehydrosuberyl-CoA semialdehyde dehydrogenase [Cyclonatronum proteinivorum]|uniref:Oxepin-CoA hydrolase / 3-oxo-5,6-dehydrosuberyl-CoA semialdehyde dehydrogenase n=1 Tax=Cyclonatronum proteinivorum TaxID=1457365 RepID=A0A345UKU5_9BACT|nr:DUF1569 domain-containing protein [Cyclonatronum proteinivorum]AXJ01097.1 oxepin-CoA hydrolase / 3-oxo-5,6-dehydrosuberyl-CoA semialdehyde dehydrogenase [Cyclonatronum proteinivorum]